MEPVLHRHLYFRNNQLEHFYNSFPWSKKESNKSTWGPSYLRLSYVSSIIISSFADHHRTLLGHLFPHLINLQSLDFSRTGTRRTGLLQLLACLNNPPKHDGHSLDDPYPLRHLCRLSFSHSELGEHTTFTHRIFTDITHLALSFHQFVDWTDLQALSNVTHLANLDLDSEFLFSPDPLGAWVTKLSNHMPPNLKILVLDFGTADWRSFGVWTTRNTPTSQHLQSMPTEKNGVAVCKCTYCMELQSNGLLTFFIWMMIGRVDHRIVVASGNMAAFKPESMRRICVQVKYVTGDFWRTEAGNFDWAAAEDIVRQRKLCGVRVTTYPGKLCEAFVSRKD